jgi:hypothetical protein
MKLSEIARYWAAKELTRITRQGSRIVFNAPFASPRFTVRLRAQSAQAPSLTAGGHVVKLEKVRRPLQLKSGAWCRDAENMTVCFDLPKGQSTIDV